MSKFVNAALIGFVSFMFLFSSYWYLEERTSSATVTFVGMDHRWGAIDGATSELRSRIVFHNAHQTLVELVRVEHEVLANGERIDWDHRNMSVRMAPGADGFAEVSARFPNSFLAPWLSGHARNGEETEFVVRGMATFNVLQSRVVVPYDWEDTWTTQIARSVAESLDGCADPVDALCIDSSSATWVSPRGNPALNLRSHLHNPNETALRLREWSVELRLHDRVVARSEFQPDAIELPGLSQTPIETFLRFEPGALSAWWPVHVGACEQSPLQIVVRFVREDATNATNLTQPASSGSWALDGPSLSTRFVCVRS